MPVVIEFANIDWAGRPVSIEYQWVGNTEVNTPLLVFLHEGLGSVSMWKDFPQQLCEAGGFRGLVYSRPGYGQSTPRTDDEHWQPDFMHRQAHEVLPTLLYVLDIDSHQQPVWLFGHSDGGSIALLSAGIEDGQCKNTKKLSIAGAIVLAPHIMVEDLSIRNIKQARKAYLETGLKQKLARYHTDPDSAFWGWNDVWLSAAFRSWSIESEISRISCPVLAIQGLDDEYGTLEQIHGIKRRVPQTMLLELPDCSHSPHRDQPAILMEAVVQFIQQNTP